MVTARRHPPPATSQKRWVSAGTPRATDGLRGECGGTPAASPHAVSPGWGRGEQPNAFQKISCKWLGRVIHIKLIKPLLVSQGRNPDVDIYLFWILLFFFLFSF